MADNKKTTHSIAELKERLGIKNQEYLSPKPPSHTVQPISSPDAIQETAKGPTTFFLNERSDEAYSQQSVDPTSDFTLIEDEPNEKQPSSFDASIKKYASLGVVCLVGLFLGYSCNSVLKSREADNLFSQGAAQTKTAVETTRKQLAELKKTLTSCQKIDKASIAACLTKSQKISSLPELSGTLTPDQINQRTAIQNSLYNLKSNLDQHWKATQADASWIGAIPLIVLAEPRILVLGTLSGEPTCRTAIPCKNEEKLLPVLIDDKLTQVPVTSVMEFKKAPINGTFWKNPTLAYLSRLTDLLNQIESIDAVLAALIKKL